MSVTLHEMPTGMDRYELARQLVLLSTRILGEEDRLRGAVAHPSLRAELHELCRQRDSLAALYERVAAEDRDHV